MNELNAILQKIAHDDNKVTEEEDAIVKSVQDFIERYNTYIKKSKADGKINEQEKNRIKEMKKEILEGAWIISMKDNKISDDESDLLSAIYEFLKKLEV